jgi:hypothetical protein
MTHDIAVPRGLRAAGIGTAIGAIHDVDGRENGHERQQADRDDSSHGRKDEIYRPARVFRRLFHSAVDLLC